MSVRSGARPDAVAGATHAEVEVVVLVLEGGIPGGLFTAEADLVPVNVEQRPFESEDPTRRRTYGF